MLSPAPLIVVVTVALCADAALAADWAKPPVCDGKHKRPANPYGSVLNAPDPSGSAVPRAVTSQATSAVNAQRRAPTSGMSGVDVHASTRPCGHPR